MHRKVVMTAVAGFLWILPPDPLVSAAPRPAPSDVPVHLTSRDPGRGNVRTDTTFDVLHYRVDLVIPLETSALSGTVTMTCRSLTDGLNRVLLDMDGALTVSTVRKDSVAVVPTYNPAELKLVIPFSQTVARHDTFTLVVEYHAAASNNGFYSYTMSAYTDWAAGWFPCHDHPWDKATFDLYVTVPPGVEVASVGSLLGRSSSGDGRWETFNWSTDHPVATHLVGMMMSRYYSRWSDWYVPSPEDSIEIAYYVFARDSALARRDFVTVVAAMDFYATTFGAYPFEKYGMAEVEPLYYGGMEYQTMSMISSSWIRGDGTAEDGFVHELAHQWWGDAVGFDDWGDMWLSEGFAEYSAALFAEHYHGDEAFRDLMDRKKRRYLQQAQSLDYSISNPVFDYSHIAIVYKKGAWVLHMLRHVVGSENFWRVLQEYYRRYRYSTVTIAQFQALAEGVCGEDLAWFFHQWIGQPGYPIISATNATTETAPGIYQCAVTLHQTSALGPVFSMPLDLHFAAGDRQLDTTIWLNSSSQTFVVVLPFSPSELQIDPLGKVLMETGSVSLDVERGSHSPACFSLSQNYPNPFNPVTSVEYTIPHAGWVSLEVFNVLGEEVATLVDRKHEAGIFTASWDASARPAGVYFFRLSAGVNVQTKKMALIR